MGQGRPGVGPADLPSYRGSLVVDVECRGESCRIEASHPDVAGYKRFIQSTFMTEAARPWNGGLETLVSTESPSNVTSVSYFGREKT